VSKSYRNCYSVQSSLTPPFKGEDKRSSFGFELYSIVKVLLFSSYIIQQKERLCINRMNLYFRDIFI